jgi:uncharacterized protein YdhG (YjbR/CyaY superfamily)
MKKTRIGRQTPVVKKSTAPRTIDEYLSRVPQPARATLQKLRATIRSVVPPDASEAIYYGMPAFRYKGPLVCFAAFSNHCSFFPSSAALMARFEDDLKKYATSKGTLRFPTDKPLPAALVKKLVKARIRQNELKKRR